MIGALEQEDEWELQRKARNKGMAIQLSPLHTALIEVHQELAKVTQEAQDIAEVCKRATKASDQMHKEWSATKKTNEELSTRLHEVELKLKHVGERLQVRESEMSQGLDRMLQEQLSEQEVIIQRANKRAEKAETEIEKITGQLLAAQKELEAMVQARQEEINALNDQLKQQIIEAKEKQEKREELQLYITMQEYTYANYLANVEIAREELTKQCNYLVEKYERKHHALIVAEAKLQFDQESAENRRQELEREILILKYKHTMGEEKVCLILTQHKQQMHQMVIDSLDKGWKTWLTQAAELQPLQADHENWKKHGQGFFKMDEASIIKVREELANDICEIITQHTEEIYKMLDEFEDQQIAMAVQLDVYEEERRRQEGEQEDKGLGIRKGRIGFICALE